MNSQKGFCLIFCFREDIREKTYVRVVIDYEDYALATETWFSNFAVKYLIKTKKVAKTVFVCSYGPQVKYFKQKR